MNPEFSVEEKKQGSLVIRFLAILPVLFPILFVAYDLMASIDTSSLVRLLSGYASSPQKAFAELMQYFAYFFPSLLLYAIWFSGGKATQAHPIDSRSLTGRQQMADTKEWSWRPQGVLAHPVNNRKWRKLKPGVFVLQSTFDYRLYTYPTLLICLCYLGLVTLNQLNSRQEIYFELYWNWALWLFLGGVMLHGFMYMLSFSGFVVKEKNRKVVLDGELVPFEAIKAIQVLHKQHSHTSGNGGVYSVYEVNLVRVNGKRTTVLNHGDLEKIFEQIRIINTYLKVPIYIDEQVGKDIDEHNQEVRFHVAS